MRGHVEAREWVALPRPLADAEQVLLRRHKRARWCWTGQHRQPQVELYSDGKALLGAFVNLLENAPGVLPPQGHIRVSTELGNGVLKLTAGMTAPA